MRFAMNHGSNARVRPISKGFTLVEILIVVIILGILAAIVIPQFTSASEDARRNSTSSLLQTIRSQVELYKMQHGDMWPTTDGTSDATKWDWELLTGKTNFAGGAVTKSATGAYGPYLQQLPKNPFNNSSSVAADGASGVGFVFESSGKFYSVDAAGADFGM